MQLKSGKMIFKFRDFANTQSVKDNPKSTLVKHIEHTEKHKLKIQSYLVLRLFSGKEKDRLNWRTEARRIRAYPFSSVIEGDNPAKMTQEKLTEDDFTQSNHKCAGLSGMIGRG